MARGPARSSWLAVVVIDPDLVAKVGGEGAGRARIDGKLLSAEMMRARLAALLPSATACRELRAHNATAAAECEELTMQLRVADEVAPWHERYAALPCAAQAAKKAAKVAAKARTKDVAKAKGRHETSHARTD